MAYSWLTQKELYRGRLEINGWGNVGNMAAGNNVIVTNHTTIEYVDVGVQSLRFKEAKQGNKSVLTQDGTGNIFTRGGVFYALPWTAGYAARTALAGANDRFVTPRLNGCAVSVSGTRAAPVVVHMNSQAEALLTPLQDDLPTYYSTWSSVYTSVVSKLVSAGLIPSANLEIFQPSTYMVDGVGSAAVFGTRSGGNWTFYYVLNRAAAGTVHQFWPA